LEEQMASLNEEKAQFDTMALKQNKVEDDNIEH
jgi:hypothetical protein